MREKTCNIIFVLLSCLDIIYVQSAEFITQKQATCGNRLVGYIRTKKKAGPKQQQKPNRKRCEKEKKDDNKVRQLTSNVQDKKTPDLLSLHHMLTSL